MSVVVSIKFEHQTRVCKWGFHGGTMFLDAAFRADAAPTRLDYSRKMEGKATTGETLTLTFETTIQYMWTANAIALDVDRALKCGICTITYKHEDGHEDFSIFNTRGAQ